MAAAAVWGGGSVADVHSGRSVGKPKALGTRAKAAASTTAPPVGRLSFETAAKKVHATLSLGSGLLGRKVVHVYSNTAALKFYASSDFDCVNESVARAALTARARAAGELVGEDERASAAEVATLREFVGHLRSELVTLKQEKAERDRFEREQSASMSAVVAGLRDELGPYSGRPLPKSLVARLLSDEDD